MEVTEAAKANVVMTLKDRYKSIAQEFPDYYSRWLTQKQAYWTIVGIPGDSRKALLCEDGTIEPHKRGFTIMPFLYMDDKIITRQEAGVSQFLEKNYLPIPSVKWRYKDVTLDIKVFVYGGLGKSVAYAWYTIKNNRRKKIRGKFFLTIRPFQVYPPWQEGTDGFAPIYSVKYTDGVVHIDGKHKICPLSKPDNFGVKKFEGADIVSDIKNGILLEGNKIEDTEGFVSAAMEYDFDLKPSASKDIFMAMPLYDKGPDLKIGTEKTELKRVFGAKLKEIAAYWEEKVNKVEIDIPDTDMVNTLKSNIAYNLITKDGPALQPGSRSYDKGWMRDGSIQGSALLRMGLTSEMKDFINWIAGFQFESGEVAPVIDNKAKDPLWEEKERGLKEYDSQGEFIWAILQYYHFTGDRKFLKSKLPRIIKALEFLSHLRGQTVTPEFKDGASEKKNFYGILPPSRSHEGYWLAYSYWDDFWALQGWKSARTIAKILKRNDLINWIDKEHEELRDSVYDSIKSVAEFKKICYIPGAGDVGEFDPTSTAGAIVYCDELENLPQPLLKNTFDRYYMDLSSRFEPAAKYRFTPYEIRNTSAFLYMDQKDRALALLRFMLKCRSPLAWNHLAEVVHSDYRFPTYIGDMPHTWVGAEYINAVRSLFAYELNDKLVLGHGIDEEWLLSEKGVSVKNMPTYYGNINYIAKKDKDTLKIKVWGGAFSPPQGFVFKLPWADKLKEVQLNKERWNAFSGNEIVFCKLPVSLLIHYRK